MLIGLTIVAFGTSAPEFAVSVKSLLSGNTDMVLGNVIGSNILNILLILGLCALFHSLKVKDNTVKKEIPITLMITTAFAVLMCDNFFDKNISSSFTRGDGLILVLFFSVFMYYIIGMAKNKVEDDIEDFVNGDSLYLSLVVNMWRFCGYETDTKKILEICRTDENWFKNHTWTKEQRAEYEHILFNILKKCLGFGDSDDDKNEVWKNIAQYSAFGGAFDLDDYSEENYKAYIELVKDISNYEK